MCESGGAASPGVDANFRRYRILHFVSTFEPKTDTKWLVQIARHLDRTRFQLTAACMYGGGAIAGRLAEWGVSTHNLGVPGNWDLRGVERARRLIEEVGADVVHTHLLRADLMGGAAARWAEVPVVVSTAYAVGEFRRAIRRRADGLLDAVCRILPTHVLAVSEAVRRDCVDRLGFSPGQVRVIRTGIDPPPAIAAAEIARVRGELEIEPSDRFVLTVARLSYEKGIDDLIDAAAIVRRRVENAKFVVLGDGPRGPELQQRIDAVGLTGCFRLAGFRENVWPYLSAADGFCLPSKMEGMPNALLEAMATGRPIAASAVGGVPEAIDNGLSGLLTPSGSPGELAAAIERLLTDTELACRLGQAARAAVDERFLARHVVARYAEWYESLIAESRGMRLAARSLPPSLARMA